VSSDIPPLRPRLLALIILGVALSAALGCRSRAQQDLYQQKMIREVRILEDKLYEADYKNRALSEKLKRARIEASEVQIHSAKPARHPRAQREESSQIEPTPDPNSNRNKLDNSRNLPEDSDDEIGLSDLLPPTFDEGDPIDPGAIETNQLRSNPEQPKNSDPVPLTDPPAPASPDTLPVPAFPGLNPRTPGSPEDTPPASTPPTFTLPRNLDSPANKSDSGASEKNLESPELKPAPSGPVPPGIEDTELPPVLPGETLPPQLAPGEENLPPGQIQLPDSVKSNQRVPDSLQIHPTLSGANRVGDQLQDILLVVNVVNDLGKTIDLNDFLVDGEMSVVVLDPQREPSVARLGRWNFDRKQVLNFVKHDPVSGFHIPLQWAMDDPLGSEVIVHVRLRAEDDEMRCEAKLNVDQQRGVAGWLPRAESFR
jgi:hypothetical protein